MSSKAGAKEIAWLDWESGWIVAGDDWAGEFAAHHFTSSSAAHVVAGAAWRAWGLQPMRNPIVDVGSFEAGYADLQASQRELFAVQLADLGVLDAAAELVTIGVLA